MLKEVKNIGATEMVVKQIVDLIKSGYYQPREKLPNEMELMEMLNVGRSTIREAKRTLASMNLIESRAGKGSFVKVITVLSMVNESMFEMILDNEVDMLHEARILVETQISILALKRATNKDLDEMQESVNSLQVAVHRNIEVYEHGRLFHQALSEAAHNPVLMKLNDILAGMLSSLQKPYYEKKYDQQMEITVHQDIVNAIRERNQWKLLGAMARHFDYVGEVAKK